MSFGQIPFLPLVDAPASQLPSELLPALARIVPVLVPSSLAESTLAALPRNAEYFILDDSSLAVDDAVKLLDKGARRIVSKNPALLTLVSADRLVLHLDKPDAALLASPELVSSISGVLLETETFLEDELKPLRTALKAAEGRPRDLFVLSASRSREKVLKQPSAFKLMAKSVNGTCCIPTSFLSTSLGNLSIPHPDDGHLSLASLYTSALRSDRPDGLFVTVPISTTSVTTPLGVVYSSTESIAHSILSGDAVYYSRSRNGLWRKGATSGAMQRVERIRVDCDYDALEFSVVESGPNGEKEGFCHVPTQTSCFGGIAGLAELESTLKKRMVEAPAGSYTKRLFDEPKLLRAKIMEEAGEVCDAETKDDLAGEVADLLYFTLTRAVSQGVSLKDVQEVLEKRSLKVTRRKGDAKPEWIDKLGLSTSQAVGVEGQK
ncbi:uncharacterized protein JCM10292_007224 [Rhodotorula paludigena]|uniref:uncharacterized protein n=1 Tax=Rhodotorula paludigena TaxID=86838 RepID=UPI003179D435